MIRSDAGSCELEPLYGQALEALEAGRTPDLQALSLGDSSTRNRLQDFCDDWRRARRGLSRRGAKTRAREESEAPAATDSAWSKVLERLASHRPGSSRYRHRGEIARGGMGAIVEVWDEDLRRRSAKKILLRGEGSSAQEGDRSIGRFLEEAQVTAQLEHPGIVPVHELGIDSDGNVYFTMRLVRGRDLKSMFRDMARGRGDWTRTRALGAVLRICEAMAYAHSRGVVHRDLKPANVMVGRFGEVYVMDWGLAHVLSPEEGDALASNEDGQNEHDEDELDRSEILTDRAEVDARGDSPILTLDGAVVGTPSFMSPEQARGNTQHVGPRSDVYAVGAILYQLLTGSIPYVVKGVPTTARTIWQRVLEGPPTPIEELADDVAPELTSITERAMARDAARRYADMQELAADLRAYLEGHVVRAHRTGALPEALKWIGRNRVAAVALAALLIVFGGSGFALLAQERGRSAEQRLHADENLAPVLLAEVDRLGPTHPDSIPTYEAWEARAVELLSRMPQYRSELERLRARAWRSTAAALPSANALVLPEVDLPHLRYGLELLGQDLAQARKVGADPDATEAARATAAREVQPLSSTVDSLRREILQAEQLLAARTTFAFHSERDRERHRRLAQLDRETERIARPETGALAVVRRRLESARTLGATLEHPLWEEAIASIADVEDCPDYEGLRIEPQLGLVPLWRNDATGLWEFLLVLSGEQPVRREGRVQMGIDTGVVFVLLPGARTTLGVQVADRDASPYEWEPIEVRLDPFFLSKYELTQGQYRRGTGQSPSQVGPGELARIGPRVDESNPVDSVSWRDASQLLRRWSLTFPTEAQWEYGARAGSPWRWSSTNEEPEIRKIANLFDAVGDMNEYRGAIDGVSEHGPVGNFPPNGFGLHDVIGNVSEWCLDWKAASNAGRPRDGDGLIVTPEHFLKVARGGSWYTEPEDARVTVRWDFPTDARDWDLGLRPARILGRTPTGERQ